MMFGTGAFGFTAGVAPTAGVPVPTGVADILKKFATTIKYIITGKNKNRKKLDFRIKEQKTKVLEQRINLLKTVSITSSIFVLERFL